MGALTTCSYASREKLLPKERTAGTEFSGRCERLGSRNCWGISLVEELGEFVSGNRRGTGAGPGGMCMEKMRSFYSDHEYIFFNEIRRV